MAESNQSRGGHNQKVAQAGEHFVVAELNKRGAFAVAFAGNMPKIDLIACNDKQSRTVHIQVKTKSGKGAWHASIKDGKPRSEPDNLQEDTFWVFVDLGNNESAPRYWVTPRWWIENDIYEAHQRYLERHGGKRAKNPTSTHHAIDETRLNQWQNRWEILEIFET